MVDANNPYAPPPAGGSSSGSGYNPYAPPSARLGTSGDVADAERIRRENLSHEASLRSIGCLYLWGGIVMLVLAALTLVVSVVSVFTETQEGGARMVGTFVVVAVVYALLGLLNWWIGRGLRDLQEKVRTALTILCVIGLLGFPIGTLISVYFLYLLHSAKGKTILTEQYRRVVAQTPHIKYKTPWITWVLLILLIVGIIIAVVLAMGT